MSIKLKVLLFHLIVYTNNGKNIVIFPLKRAVFYEFRDIFNQIYTKYAKKKQKICSFSFFC